MNLWDAVDCLQEAGVDVAIDLGLHISCNINSNCPVAIKIRKMITDSGIELSQVIEAYKVLSPNPLFDLSNLLPITAKQTISITGKQVEIDITEVVKPQLGEQLRRKLSLLSSYREETIRYGRGLLGSYEQALVEARRTKALPQLNISAHHLLSHRAFIASDGDQYLIYFEGEYGPKYLIKGGIRYEIDSVHQKDLVRDVLLCFTINGSLKFVSATILKYDLNKLQHYHGRDYDCWGIIKIPASWNKNWETLVDLRTLLMNSLRTINMDSLVSREPYGMILVDDLMDKARKLGKEGMLNQTQEQTMDTATTPTRTRITARWGGGNERW